ncbi:metallophosphoesterase family protein [Evansella halocellulosilytica]|uniref:metallophosphoesterase family protein n=1 Tax=Evansella halocellulosilytica TaxID=2011013 RepID=UPI000BB77309|nr:metallophosphoesterase [Evansella halocellulosilytica]
MKALIMSDSHGWDEQVQQVVDRHQHEVDAMFHCGDSELNGHAEPLKNVITVRGNCDFGNDFKEEEIKEIEGVKFFIAHGHLLNVKMTEMNILLRGEESGADVICYGHTHVPVAVQEKGKVIINPGSMRLPRRFHVGTYVIVTVDENEVVVDFYDVAGTKVEELSKSFSRNS